MTDIDFDKVLWSTLFPIDKIVYVSPSSEVIVNPGPTDHQLANITTTNLTNPYGKKCFARAIWSLDGVSWKSTHSRMTYTYSYTDTTFPFTVTLSALRAAVSIGASASTVRILTGNCSHGNVTFNGSSTTFTPNSETFYVKYALFEIQ